MILWLQYHFPTTSRCRKSLVSFFFYFLLKIAIRFGLFDLLPRGKHLNTIFFSLLFDMNVYVACSFKNISLNYNFDNNPIFLYAYLFFNSGWLIMKLTMIIKLKKKDSRWKFFLITTIVINDVNIFYIWVVMKKWNFQISKSARFFLDQIFFPHFEY